jgi:N-hydroxyarylamine O-acetyltransferase
MKKELDVRAYLRRIGYAGPTAPSAETLRALHRAHMLAVPFENLSIHAREPIELDEELLFDKVVRRGRGGFCYELNGLFGALLRALGFRVEMLSARVANERGEFGPEFDHMALMVTLEERWLADVGFGASFLEPLLLDETDAQRRDEGVFRIDGTGAHRLLMQLDDKGEWQPQYRFTLQPHQLADYTEMCRYHQTSPDSHFTRKRVCSRATHDGRITLSDMTLITTVAGERRERVLASVEEYEAALREHFGFSMEARRD